MLLYCIWLLIHYFDFVRNQSISWAAKFDCTCMLVTSIAFRMNLESFVKLSKLSVCCSVGKFDFSCNRSSMGCTWLKSWTHNTDWKSTAHLIDLKSRVLSRNYGLVITGNYGRKLRVVKLKIAGKLREMYLISAADHTSVKRRRRSRAPPCASSRPRTCVADGDVAGDAYVEANASVAAAGRERNRDSDVN